MSALFDNIDAEYIRNLLDSESIFSEALAYRRQLEKYCDRPGVSGITELRRSNNVLFQWKKHAITKLSKSNKLVITCADAFARLSERLDREKARLESTSATSNNELLALRPLQPNSFILDVNQIETQSRGTGSAASESRAERRSAARSETNSAVYNMHFATLAIINYCKRIMDEMRENTLEQLISGDDVSSVDNSFLSQVMRWFGIGDSCEDQDDFIKFSMLYFVEKMIFDNPGGEFNLPLIPECVLVGTLAVYGMKMAHLMEQSQNFLVITRLYEEGWMHKKLSDFEIGEIVRLASIAAIDIDMSIATKNMSGFLSMLRSVGGFILKAMLGIAPVSMPVLFIITAVYVPVLFGIAMVSIPVTFSIASLVLQLRAIIIAFFVAFAYRSFQVTGGIILLIQFAFLPFTRCAVYILLLLLQTYRLAYSLLNGHGAADIERNRYDIRDTMRRISEADRIALEPMFRIFSNALSYIFGFEPHSDLPGVGGWTGRGSSPNSESVNAVAAHILEELNFFNIPWGEFKRAVLKSGAAMIFRMDTLPFNGVNTSYVRASTESRGGKVYSGKELNRFFSRLRNVEFLKDGARVSCTSARMAIVWTYVIFVIVIAVLTPVLNFGKRDRILARISDGVWAATTLLISVFGLVKLVSADPYAIAHALNGYRGLVDIDDIIDYLQIQTLDPNFSREEVLKAVLAVYPLSIPWLLDFETSFLSKDPSGDIRLDGGVDIRALASVGIIVTSDRCIKPSSECGIGESFKIEHSENSNLFSMRRVRAEDAEIRIADIQSSGIVK